LILYEQNDCKLLIHKQGNNISLCKQDNIFDHFLFEKSFGKWRKFWVFLYTLKYSLFSFPYVLFDGMIYKALPHYLYHRQDQGIRNNELYDVPVKQFSLPCHYEPRTIDRYNYLFQDILCAIQYIQYLYNVLVVLWHNHLSIEDDQVQTCDINFWLLLSPKHQLIFEMVFFLLVFPLMLLKSFSFLLQGKVLQAMLVFPSLIQKFFYVLLVFLKDCDLDGFDMLDDTKQNKIQPFQTFFLKIQSYNICKFLSEQDKPFLITSNPKLP